jgi:hypothetical protein
MSRSYTPIWFFSDEITLKPHTATYAHWIERPVSVREFAAGMPVKLSRNDDNGEYLVETNGYPVVFMEGPEV